MTKNDSAWEQLFEKYDILNRVVQDGEYIIEASQIKEFREARLMHKMDDRESQPKIMKDNHSLAETLNRDFADWQVQAQEPDPRQTEFAFSDEIPTEPSAEATAQQGGGQQ